MLPANMSSISFTFRADSSEEDRAAALRQIQAWAGVRAASLLKADAKNPAVRRMAMLMLEPTGVTADVIKGLRALPVVEQASIPAQRGLSSGGSADAAK
jgi:hypothetical protein